MTNRFKILRDYVKANSCADILEIGVYQGSTSQLLITSSSAPKVNYVGVDLFEDIDDVTMEYEKALKPGDLESVLKNLTSLNKGNCILHQGNSREVLPELEGSFDLIFIDGGHSYETISSDFKNSLRLLKQDGIIFIDDYTDEDYMKDVRKFCDELKVDKRFETKVRTEHRDTYRGADYFLFEVKRKTPKCDILMSFNKEFLRTFQDICVPNLPKKTTLYVRYIKGEVDKRFGVFYQKMEFVRNHILKTDNLVFFCDSDVVILDDNIVSTLMRIYHESGEPDLLMQWNQLDDPEKNIGVMLIKPGTRTQELYKKYCEASSDWIIENYGFDQKYFNYLLETEFEDLKVAVLPISFYGGQMRGVYDIPKDIQLYHATFEKTFQDKHNVMKAYVEKIKQGL